MLDAKRFAEAVMQARNERAISVRALVEEIGEDNISESTVKRIEHGVTVKPQFVVIVANALGINLAKYVDYDFAFCYMDSFRKKEKEQSRTNMKSRLKRVEEYLLGNSVDMMPVASLYIFLIYLPLFSPAAIAELLYRMDGDYVGREPYLAKQLRHLREVSVKDDDALRYAYRAAEPFFKHALTGADTVQEMVSEDEETLIRQQQAYRNRLEKFRQQARALAALM